MIETNGQHREYVAREHALKATIATIETLQIALLAAHATLPSDMRTDMDNLLCDKQLEAEHELAEVSLALDIWNEKKNYDFSADGQIDVGV